MKTFERGLQRTHPWLFCCHWNGSLLEMGLQPELLRSVPEGKIYHYHDYHEYYVVLHSEAALDVDGIVVKLLLGVVVMVEPFEGHSVT